MAAPLQATIIQGPAIVTFNSQSYYTQSGIRITHDRRSFDVTTDMWGKIDTRLESDVVRISFTPAGEIENLAKYFPYGPASISAATIAEKTGQSIMGSTVVIHTLAGQVITYSRGAITKVPQLRLRPTETLFGEMEITCIGKASTDRSSTDYWKAITSSSFSNTDFNETLIKTAVYQAAWGSSPYDAIGSLNGFTVDTELDVAEITSVDLGIVDLVMRSISVSVSFAPNNLTEAQIDTAMKHSGSSPIYPGESFGKAGTDLVITSDAFNYTLHKAGPVAYEAEHATGVHRHRNLTFTARRAWSTGAASALFTIT